MFFVFLLMGMILPGSFGSECRRHGGTCRLYIPMLSPPVGDIDFTHWAYKMLGLGLFMCLSCCPSLSLVWMIFFVWKVSDTCLTSTHLRSVIFHLLQSKEQNLTHWLQTETGAADWKAGDISQSLSSWLLRGKDVAQCIRLSSSVLHFRHWIAICFSW